jgi:cytochrome c biogenesis protein CcdA
LILLFGLHLLGWLAKLSFRAGIVIGTMLVLLGLAAALRGGPLFASFRAIHFLSLSLVGFFGPTMARWLNRDVHLRTKGRQPGVWSGFLLGFAFAFGWTPCIGPILATVLALRHERHGSPWGAAARGLFGGARRPIPVDRSRHRPVPEVL